jgi:hypothetical protein
MGHQPALRTQRELDAGRDGDCGGNHRRMGEDSSTRGEGGNPGGLAVSRHKNRVERYNDRVVPRPRGSSS